MLATTNPFLHHQMVMQDVASSARRSRAFLWVWVIYIFLSPFYVFQSGVPQPSDIFIFTGILAFFSYAFLRYSSQDNSNVTGVYIFGGIFVGLTATINAVHYFFTPDIKFILHSIYYLFNFLIFIYAILIFRQSPDTANKWTYRMVAAIIMVQLVFVLFFPDADDYRASGTFNRSNQLAYWGVLSAAIIVVLKRHEPMKGFDLVLLAILGYIEMKALSKAGMIVFVVLLAITLFSPSMTKRMRWIAILCFALIFMVKFHNPQQLFTFVDKIDTLEAVSDRLGTLGKQADDTAEARGYGRLLEYPQFVLVGAGEGAHWRFGRQELHSGIATLIFSYSIFGFAFFLMFLGSIFYRLPWHYTAMLIPIFLYGLSHQNVRFSYFWVFLALAYSWHFFKNENQQLLPPQKRLHGRQ